MRKAPVALALMASMVAVTFAVSQASSAGLSAACRDGVVAVLPNSDVIVYRKHHNQSSIIVYRGTQHAIKMSSCGIHHDGVVVLFDTGRAYFSPDCLDLGGQESITQVAYDGAASGKIVSIAPFKTGVVTTFRGAAAGPALAEAAEGRRSLAQVAAVLGGHLHLHRSTKFYSRDCQHLGGGGSNTSREPF